MTESVPEDRASRPDIRDVVLEEFARSELFLRERVSELETEVAALRLLCESRGDDSASMRLVAVQGLHALHEEQRAHSQLKARYERLVEEYRAFRADAMLKLTRAA